MFILIDAALLALAAAVGIASGFGLRHLRAQRRVVADVAARNAAAHEKARAAEMLSQLHELAANVAAHVGEHSSRVQEINTELTSPEAVTQDGVMSAVAKLMEANVRMQQELDSAERKLEEKQRELESKATEARTDALTQLNNRRAFDEHLRKCQHKYRQQGRPASLMMIDVDHFKIFNDTHGHKAGDEVLRHVARTLQETVAATEIVCRYGGEEFAVIFPGSPLAAARAAAERARAALGACRVEFEGKLLQVTASAGLAEFLLEETGEAVVQRADAALYFSKQAGRDRGHYHDGRDFLPFVSVEPVKTEVTAAVEPAVEKRAEKTAPPAEPIPLPELRKDDLTGLSNRTAFYDDLNRRVAEWKRGGASLSVVLMQIDHFQDIALEHTDKAHHVVLRAAAQFLKATMRDMDHVARYDDDTFSILLPTAELANAIAIAERLRRAVGRCRLPFKRYELTFTASFGVAEAMQGDSTGRLLQRTKLALDTSTSIGGDRTFFHDGENCVAVDAAQPVATAAVTT